jgi:hypothetical protein
MAASAGKAATDLMEKLRTSLGQSQYHDKQQTEKMQTDSTNLQRLFDKKPKPKPKTKTIEEIKEEILQKITKILKIFNDDETLKKKYSTKIKECKEKNPEFTEMEQQLDFLKKINEIEKGEEYKKDIEFLADLKKIEEDIEQDVKKLNEKIEIETSKILESFKNAAIRDQYKEDVLLARKKLTDKTDITQLKTLLRELMEFNDQIQAFITLESRTLESHALDFKKYKKTKSYRKISRKTDRKISHKSARKTARKSKKRKANRV